VSATIAGLYLCPELEDLLKEVRIIG